MKKALALALTMCMVISMVSFASAEDAGFEITACIASEPETLDPSLISSVDGSTYAHHMFEGLMKYAPVDSLAGADADVKNADAVLGQAESYTVSEDGMVYTFTLRDDIFWSDGKPVTADDFVYGWSRVIDPASAADYGYILDGIVLNAAAIQKGEKDISELGLKAIDEKTLEITLEAKTPYFVSLCAFAALMPLRKDVIEQFGNEWTNPENLVGNGPFGLTEWVHDSYIKMTASETYYNAAAVGPQTITWYLSDSETSILAAYQADQYDLIENIPTDQIKPLQDAGILYIVPQIGLYYLYMQCEHITDWRVRAAIVLCVDRENIVENVTQAGQLPATGLVPGGIFDSELNDWTSVVGEPMYAWLGEQYPDYDLTDYYGRCELAQALLAEAVADGYDTSVTLNYEFNTSETHKAVAEAVQSDIESVLGLSVSLNNSEWQTYTNNLGEGGFDVARLGWIADFNDAVSYVDLFMIGASYNYGRWVSDEYTQLVKDAKALPGGAERDAKMAEAEALAFKEGGFPVIPLYFYTQMYCLDDNFENVIWTPLGYFFLTYATQK